MRKAAMETRKQSRAAIHAAARDVKRTCGEMTAVIGSESGTIYGCGPEAATVKDYSRGEVLPKVIGLIVVIAVLALLVTGCRHLEMIGGGLQTSGDMIAAVPHPLAIPVGAFVSGAGVLLSAYAKFAEKPKLLKAGLASIVLGAVEAGGELGLSPTSSDQPAAIVGPVEPGAVEPAPTPMVAE